MVGLHKHVENVCVSVVKNCSAYELMPIIEGKVLEGSDIYTDGWKAYDGLFLVGYHHHRIHHHKTSLPGEKPRQWNQIVLVLCQIPLLKTTRRL